MPLFLCENDVFLEWGYRWGYKLGLHFRGNWGYKLPRKTMLKRGGIYT